jgi:hypothetical protein
VDVCTLHRRVVTGDENSSVLDLLRTKKKRIAHKLSTPVAVKLIDKVGRQDLWENTRASSALSA